MSYIDPNDRPAPRFEDVRSALGAEPPPVRRGRRGAGVAIGLGLAVIFGLGVWYAYSQGVQKGGNIVPPLIKADQAPVKRPPENPGGMQVPNQGIQIYETVGGATPKSQGVERLLPPPEQPKPEPPAPPKIAQPQPAQPQPAASPSATPAAAPGAGTPPMPAVPQGQVATATIQPPAGTPPAPPPSAVEPAKAAPVATQPAPATQTAALPGNRAVAAPGTGSAPPPPPAPSSASGGNFRIQLGALAEQAAAETEWKRLARAHSDLLGGLPHAVEKADIPGKGTFFRIYAGAFPDRATAVAVCDRLRAQAPRQGCIVAAR